MHAIKMKRLELLEIVRANKLKHIASYDEAVIDYKQLVLQTATANLKLAKTQDLESFSKIRSSPMAPTSYEDSYQRAIRMLKLSVEEIIDVDEDIFNQLVLDEWTWKRNFMATTMAYKASL
jgi:hypothetical protein